MSLQASIRRNTLGLFHAGRVSIERPNGLIRLNRTKTTAASINAKAIASTKKKLADAFKNPKNGGLSSNVSTSIKPTPQVANRFKNPALKQDPKIVDEADKTREQNEMFQKSGTSAIFSKYVKPPDSSQSKPVTRSRQELKTLPPEKPTKSASHAQSSSPQSKHATKPGQKSKSLAPGKSKNSASHVRSPGLQLKPAEFSAGNAQASTSENTAQISSNLPSNPLNLASKNRQIKAQSLLEPHKSVAQKSPEFGDHSPQKVARLPKITEEKPLPPNYKATLRRVTMAIVAMPIALVTSWILFERRE